MRGAVWKAEEAMGERHGGGGARVESSSGGGGRKRQGRRGIVRKAGEP